MKKLGVVLLVGYLVSQRAAAQSGATYYASPSGSDSYSCAQARSSSTPRQTINNGVACLTSGGDTLLVRGGTYSESLANPAIASGTSWANKVRIAAYPGETVWIRPTTAALAAVVYLGRGKYVEFDGISIDYTALGLGYAGLAISSGGGDTADHIRYQNAEVVGPPLGGGSANGAVGIVLHSNDFTTVGFNELINLKVHGMGGNNSDYGMYISSSNNLVEDCEIYAVSEYGIHINGNFAGINPAANNTIRKNRIHDITQGYDQRRSGIVLDVGSNTLVYDNVIYNIGGVTFDSNQSGIQVYAGDSNLIYNNTIANNTGEAIQVGNVTNTAVTNNIAYGNVTNGVVDYGSTNTTQTTNLFGVNPKFVNAAQGNFQLQSGSPAINAGTVLSLVTTDIVGLVRPQGGAYDIGAYQHQRAAPPAPTGVHVVSP